MKKCTKCRIVKEDTEFFKRNDNVSGLYSQCRSCSKAVGKRVELTCNRCGKLFTARSVAFRQYCSRSCSTSTNNLRRAMSDERRRKRIAARVKVNNFLKQNPSYKPNKCMRCNCEKRVQAHHPNYDKWNLVVWTCLGCHRLVHRGASLGNIKPILLEVKELVS